MIIGFEMITIPPDGKRKTGFLHISSNGFPGLFQDFKPNVHDQTEISV